MEKVRQDLKIIRQVQTGEVCYIVKDPTAMKYYRFGELEVSLFRHLDGINDYDDVARLVTADTGTKLTASHIAGFIEAMKKLDFLERTASEKSLLMLEHLREERKLKAKVGAEGKDILYQRFPLYDPDELYNRLMKRIGFLWSRQFFILYMIMFSLAATIIVSHWQRVSDGLSRLRSFESVNDGLTFVGILIIVIFFHENGHGLTCKRFGGEVHEVGFMLIFFLPAFYANVSDAWTFQSKASKLWVTFAGAFVELILSSIASFIWYFSAPGYLTHDVAFKFMLVSGLSSILVNMNPLIKLDGYFALVDYLDVPGLSDNSMSYLSALVRKYIFRAQVKIPDHKPRVKRILFIYAVLAICYRIIFLTFVLLFFNRVIGDLFPEAGVFIFPFVAVLLLRKRLKSLWNGVHHVYVDKKEVLMKPRSIAIGAAAFAVLLGLLFFAPLPYSHRTGFVIEPAERISVRAPDGGFIRKIMVSEGEQVSRGALLAVLRDADLGEKRDALNSQIAVLDRRILTERAQGRTAESLEIQRDRSHLHDELKTTESRLRELVLTAPADGIVLTPKLEDRVGTMLKPGDTFCELASIGAPRVRVTIDDWDLQDIRVGARAALRLNSIPGREISGRIISLSPASELHQHFSSASKSSVSEGENATGNGVVLAKASGRPQVSSRMSSRERAEATAAAATSPFEAPLTRFDALIEVEGDTAAIKPGMSGEVKIYGRNRPLGVRMLVGVRDWFRSEVWW